jgi:ribosome-binding protein aMBF1 (putative translation factor)
MLIYRCDLCGNIIEGEPVSANQSYWAHADLCESCGKPILDFLDKNELFDHKAKRDAQSLLDS